MANSYQVRQAKAHIQQYLNSDMSSLYDAYNTCSGAKERAWQYCLRLMEKFNGTSCRVISYNTFMFTAGFQYVDEETGVLMFMYITPEYDVSVPLTFGV